MTIALIMLLSAFFAIIGYGFGNSNGYEQGKKDAETLYELYKELDGEDEDLCD